MDRYDPSEAIMRAKQACAAADKLAYDKGYADAIRQQAARVDEVTDAMVDAAIAACDQSHKPTDYQRQLMRAALTAALAQNAQGEAVGEIVPRFEGHSVVQLFDADLPLGTKLYTHAERARVPENDK